MTISFRCLESRIDKNNTLYSKFSFTSLPLGQANTFANALRRSLLADLSGLAITHFSVTSNPGLSYEFTTLPGLLESLLDFSLNLKKVVLAGRLTSVMSSSFCPAPLDSSFLNYPNGDLTYSSYACSLPLKDLRSYRGTGAHTDWPKAVAYAPVKEQGKTGVTKVHNTEQREAYHATDNEFIHEINHKNKISKTIKTTHNPFESLPSAPIGFLKIKGPAVIRAGDLILPPGIRCVHPDQYLGTLAADGFLSINFLIGVGKGYIIQEEKFYNSLSRAKLVLSSRALALTPKAEKAWDTPMPVSVSIPQYSMPLPLAKGLTPYDQRSKSLMQGQGHGHEVRGTGVKGKTKALKVSSSRWNLPTGNSTSTFLTKTTPCASSYLPLANQGVPQDRETFAPLSAPSYPLIGVLPELRSTKPEGLAVPLGLPKASKKTHKEQNQRPKAYKVTGTVPVSHLYNVKQKPKNTNTDTCAPSQHPLHLYTFGVSKEQGIKNISISVTPKNLAYIPLPQAELTSFSNHPTYSAPKVQEGVRVLPVSSTPSEVRSKSQEGHKVKGNASNYTVEEIKNVKGVQEPGLCVPVDEEQWQIRKLRNKILSWDNKLPRFLRVSNQAQLLLMTTKAFSDSNSRFFAFSLYEKEKQLSTSYAKGTFNISTVNSKKGTGFSEQLNRRFRQAMPDVVTPLKSSKLWGIPLGELSISSKTKNSPFALWKSSNKSSWLSFSVDKKFTISTSYASVTPSVYRGRGQSNKKVQYQPKINLLSLEKRRQALWKGAHLMIRTEKRNQAVSIFQKEKLVVTAYEVQNNKFSPFLYGTLPKKSKSQQKRFSGNIASSNQYNMSAEKSLPVGNLLACSKKAHTDLGDQRSPTGQKIFNTVGNRKSAAFAPNIEDVKELKAYTNARGEQVVRISDANPLGKQHNLLNKKDHYNKEPLVAPSIFGSLIKLSDSEKLSKKQLLWGIEDNIYPVLPLDATFTPVSKVNYQIDIERNTEKSEEKIIFEVWTNGSITPKRAIQESALTLAQDFYSFFCSVSESSSLNLWWKRESLQSKNIAYPNFLNSALLESSLLLSNQSSSAYTFGVRQVKTKKLKISLPKAQAQTTTSNYILGNGYKNLPPVGDLLDLAPKEHRSTPRRLLSKPLAIRNQEKQLTENDRYSLSVHQRCKPLPLPLPLSLRKGHGLTPYDERSKVRASLMQGSGIMQQGYQIPYTLRASEHSDHKIIRQKIHYLHAFWRIDIGELDFSLTTQLLLKKLKINTIYDLHFFILKKSWSLIFTKEQQNEIQNTYFHFGLNTPFI